jgi:hypothetical protein
MLLQLAASSRELKGWGVDSNPLMCATARKRIAASGATRRITISKGDCRDLKGVIPNEISTKVRTITASCLATEFFSHDSKVTVEWLSSLKEMLSGRNLLISDYYGQLGRTRKAVSREVGLHDFVQTISGQGVPPPNLEAWQRIYRKADCDLVDTVERRSTPFFIQVLKL